MNVEAIGLTATLVVLLSFTRNKVERIRVINILGACLFVVYGVLIGSASTWLLNGALIVIHMFYLLKNLKERL